MGNKYNRYTMFSEKDDTLYILGGQLLPNTRGLNFREHCNAYDRAFAMDYTKRLELYANDECKREVAEQLKLHAGCKISEFDYA